MRSKTYLTLGLALMIAASVRAQNEPALELAPLTPPRAPWLHKNQKKEEKPAPPKQAKKSKKKPAKPAAPEVKEGAPFVAAPPPLALPPLPVEPPPAATPPSPTAPAIASPPAKEPAPAQAQPKLPEPPLPLPPLVPAPPPAPIAITSLGVLLQNDGLDPAAAARVEEGLRGVAKVAPLTRGGPALVNPATPCVDVSCLSALAAAQKLDQLLVASYEKNKLRMRLIDANQKKQLSEAEQAQVGHDAAEATAQAEALACKLIVPNGCTGEILAEIGEGVQVESDGQPLKDRNRVPVGMRQLKARAGAQTAESAIAVTREGAARVSASVVNGSLVLAPAAEAGAAAPLATARLARKTPPPAAAPEAATAVTPAPAAAAAQGSWTKPAGIAAFAVGGALGVAGIIMGAKSHSDLNTAESAFHANNGVWRPGDLQTLDSGNNAAKSANILFVTSGVLLLAGAALTFAF